MHGCNWLVPSVDERTGPGRSGQGMAEQGRTGRLGAACALPSYVHRGPVGGQRQGDASGKPAPRAAHCTALRASPPAVRTCLLVVPAHCTFASLLHPCAFTWPNPNATAHPHHQEEHRVLSSKFSFVPWLSISALTELSKRCTLGDLLPAAVEVCHLQLSWMQPMGLPCCSQRVRGPEPGRLAGR